MNVGGKFEERDLLDLTAEISILVSETLSKINGCLNTIALIRVVRAVGGYSRLVRHNCPAITSVSSVVTFFEDVRSWGGSGQDDRSHENDKILQSNHVRSTMKGGGDSEEAIVRLKPSSWVRYILRACGAAYHRELSSGQMTPCLENRNLEIN